MCNAFCAVEGTGAGGVGGGCDAGDDADEAHHIPEIILVEEEEDEMCGVSEEEKGDIRGCHRSDCWTPATGQHALTGRGPGRHEGTVQRCALRQNGLPLKGMIPSVRFRGFS